MVTRVRLLAAAAVLMLAVTSTLHAHPRLRRSEPAAGAVLSSSPAVIALYFSEAPELALTSVSLTGPGGLDRLTRLAIDVADPHKLIATVPRELLPGGYTLTWRTAASDGHPTQGTFEFTVAGSLLPAAPETTAVPGSGSVESAIQSPFQIALRASSLMALIAVLGAVAFRTAVVPRIRDWNANVRTAVLRRCAMLGAISATVLLLLSPVRFQLQATMMSGHMTGDPIRTLMMNTRWGDAWMLSTAAAALALSGFVIARLRAGIGWSLAAGGAATLAIGASLSGHAGASPRLMPFAVAVDAIHIVGAAGWLGSLLHVIVAGVPAIRNRENGARTIATLVNAFSPTALAFAGLVVVSGALSAWLRLGAIDEIWSSQYGRVLLLKLLALTGVIATGAYNWRRVRPALGVDAATAKFQWSARSELAIGAVVIFITAILIATPPPTDRL